VEHVLVDLSPAGVPSPVAGTQGALQGAAIAGGGYYSRETGHTAVFSTPSPANILSDTAERNPAGAGTVAVEFTVAREDWVQPTVMWCTRTSVQEYDRLTEKPAPAPANYEVRNQALSICTMLANAGTLYPVREIVRGAAFPFSPDSQAPVGLQNDPGTGPRPSIVPTAGFSSPRSNGRARRLPFLPRASPWRCGPRRWTSGSVSRAQRCAAS